MILILLSVGKGGNPFGMPNTVSANTKMLGSRMQHSLISISITNMRGNLITTSYRGSKLFDNTIATLRSD